MRLWLDTEFNGFNGQLLSVGIIDEDWQEFYVELPVHEVLDPWVEQHVMPMMYNRQMAHALAQIALQRFLNKYATVDIFVDYPDDIRYLCQMLIVGPGEQLVTPPLSFHLIRGLANTADTSVRPHNALADAMALRHSHIQKERAHR